ncbi:MAG: class II aldolase/adducin family protein [Desulfobulbaceae bacterium]|jgi:ribulose-5-phosphate 4-epimerase/fuculose-1-phosphate aldolase|nr:class II aldolase/adducin family protein [Desulfobulbaceae bacterium]
MSEEYQGVRFTTSFLGHEPPRHRLLPELRRWCRIFHDRGLAPPYPGGSSGNLSFRAENSFIITGTAIGLKDNLTDDAFVEVVGCDVAAGRVEARGGREPSSETMLHALLYQHFPQIGAVFHGHHEVITREAEALGLPQSPCPLPYGSGELAEAAWRLAGQCDFFVLRDHGFVATGPDMASCGGLCLRWLGKITGPRPL